MSSVDYRATSEIRLLALRIASEETTQNGVTMLRDLALIEFLARAGHEDEFFPDMSMTKNYNCQAKTLRWRLEKYSHIARILESRFAHSPAAYIGAVNIRISRLAGRLK